MSLRLKEKEIKESFYVVGIAYCDLQYLLQYFTRTGYTAGVYGWNSDFYQVDNSNFGISTGYGYIQNVKIDDNIKRKIIKKYNDKAKKYNFDNYKDMQKTTRKDLLSFVKEIRKNIINY